MFYKFFFIKSNHEKLWNIIMDLKLFIIIIIILNYFFIIIQIIKIVKLTHLLFI